VRTQLAEDGAALVVRPERAGRRVGLIERARALALRIAGAAQEATILVPAHQHRAAADVARLTLGREDLLDDRVGGGLALLEPFAERTVEAPQQRTPLDLALLDPVELAFHAA